MVDQEIERALEAFERGHASGATSEELVALLRKLGERFTESTLRKYVQLGLLPSRGGWERRGSTRGPGASTPHGRHARSWGSRRCSPAAGRLTKSRTSGIEKSCG